jgi:Fur family ferric uptake transcriptional regulator
MTQQRRVILEELRKVASHPTADQIYEMVRRRLPRVSLGTVYRNLEVLSEQGVIRTLEWGGMPRRFDGNPGTHYHVRCVRCGRAEDVDVRPLSGIEEAARSVSDYQVIGHRVEVMGICPQCRGEAQQRGKQP